MIKEKELTNIKSKEVIYMNPDVKLTIPDYCELMKKPRNGFRQQKTSKHRDQRRA